MKKRLMAGLFSLALTMVLFTSTSALKAYAADSQSFTGVISDSMCGAKHVTKGDDAACARGCVEHGANYALVVGDKVYTLEGNKDELGKYAGKTVTVKGNAEGNTIKVAAVKPAKS